MHALMFIKSFIYDKLVKKIPYSNNTRSYQLQYVGEMYVVHSKIEATHLMETFINTNYDGISGHYITHCEDE